MRVLEGSEGRSLNRKVGGRRRMACKMWEWVTGDGRISLIAHQCRSLHRKHYTVPPVF